MEWKFNSRCYHHLHRWSIIEVYHHLCIILISVTISCRVDIDYSIEPSGVSRGSNLRKRHRTDWHLALRFVAHWQSVASEGYSMAVWLWNSTVGHSMAPDWHLTTFLLRSVADVASGASDHSDSTLVSTILYFVLLLTSSFFFVRFWIFSFCCLFGCSFSP